MTAQKIYALIDDILIDLDNASLACFKSCSYVQSIYPINQRYHMHEGRAVHIISNESTCNKIINELFTDVSIIGFDCEWTPLMPHFNCKRYKIGLLQLATNTDVVLIRLNKLNYTIPDRLRQLLANKSIIKCGVGIHQDVTKLFRDFDVKTFGVIELNDLYVSSSFFDSNTVTF